MKKLLLAVAIIGAAFYSQAQGLVQFNTRNSTVNAKVYDVDGVTPLAGANFWAQMYAADGVVTDTSKLAAKGTPVSFQTGSGAGFVSTSSPFVPSVAVSAAAGTVTIQVKAWAGVAGSTFDSAVKKGWSTPIQVNAKAAPDQTPYLVGLKSFQLTPEPSTIALGVMGLSLLVFRRRK